MDFRDPLFNVIMFFTVVFLSVLITIAFGKFREHIREKKLNEFLKDFEYIKIENLKLDNASIDALYLLAKAYEKEGDFEKSLKIYLWINKNIKSIEILRQIATLYYKAGFLEKAKNIAYQILLARLHYYRVRERLPNYKDVDSMAKYYKRYYNTYKGKADIKTVIKNYERFCK